MAFWIAFVFAGVFALWQVVLTYQSWSIQNALLRHQTQKGEAVVTRVSSLNRRGGWCTIEIWAEIPVAGSTPISIKGPGGYLSLIGRQMDWFDCRTRERPAAYTKMIAVGDRIPVFYAIDDPSVNRPAWVDYPAMESRVRFMPVISLALAVGLLFCAVCFQKGSTKFRY